MNILTSTEDSGISDIVSPTEAPFFQIEADNVVNVFVEARLDASARWLPVAQLRNVRQQLIETPKYNQIRVRFEGNDVSEVNKSVNIWTNQ